MAWQPLVRLLVCNMYVMPAGEDIYHSLVAFKITGNWHMSMLPRPMSSKYFVMLNESNGISNRPLGSGFNHVKYRNEFLLEALKRLQID